MILWTVAAILFLRTAEGCECLYVNQSYSNWQTFYIQGGFTSSGESCATTCTYYLDSDDDSLGVGNLKVLTNADGYTIDIYNYYPNRTVTPLITSLNGKTSLPDLQSVTRMVMINLTSSNDPYLATLTQTKFPIATTPTLSPLTTTTVPPYNGTDLDSNPALISNDLLIMVDGGKNKDGPAAFNQAKDLAAQIVEKISSGVITGNASTLSSRGTRLALNQMTLINSGPLVQPWHSNASIIASQIRGLPQVPSLTTSYATALASLVQETSMFSVDNAEPYEYQNTRPNTQRLLIVVSNIIPDSTDNVTGIDFSKYDIHPIFIAYNTSTADVFFTNIKASGWSVFPANNSSSTTVADFVNKFLLTSNTVCASIVPGNQDITISSNEGNISIPNNYQLANKAGDNWKPNPQTARYCNKQKITYNFRADNSTNTTCFRAYYEIEPEKDSLKFYKLSGNTQGDELIVLSGLDVSGTQFEIVGDVQVIFETNEYDVRGGFILFYKSGPCNVKTPA